MLITALVFGDLTSKPEECFFIIIHGARKSVKSQETTLISKITKSWLTPGERQESRQMFLRAAASDAKNFYPPPIR